MLVHGFDVPLDEESDFKSAHVRAQELLAGTGLELVSVSTNLRQLGQDWEDGFALAVASCLALLAPEYGVGLIGSSEPYDHLVIPWGSNPVTDPLMTTGQMEIRHDGAGASRSDKVALIADWPEARRHIRVCWQGDQLDRNCGECEKCVRTVLNFRAVGGGLPGCFDRDVTDKQIRAQRLTGATIEEWRSIYETARRNGHSGSWTDAVLSAVRRSTRQNDLVAAVRRRPAILATARFAKASLRRVRNG